jgi:hypothetical protein
MNATQFAANHATDADWVAAMNDANLNAIVWNAGDKVAYSGFAATVIRHFRNGMYEIRLASGETVVDARYLTAI